MKKETKKTTFLKNAMEYITKDGVRRTTLGISLCVGSLLYIVFLADVQFERNLCGNILYFIDTAVFLAGLMIITQSFDKFTKIMNRGIFEVSGAIFALISAIMLIDCMNTSFARLTHKQQLVVFCSLIFFTWYVIRLGRFIFGLMKKTINLLLEFIKGKEMKSVTELIDAVLKNILSIAGTIALLYKALEPLINKILGI